MKYIEICRDCRGKGAVTYLHFFSKSCSTCNGKGRTVTVLSSKHF